MPKFKTDPGQAAHQTADLLAKVRMASDPAIKVRDFGATEYVGFEFNQSTGRSTYSWRLPQLDDKWRSVAHIRLVYIDPDLEPEWELSLDYDVRTKVDEHYRQRFAPEEVEDWD